jgi:hypothetical protein
MGCREWGIEDSSHSLATPDKSRCPAEFILYMNQFERGSAFEEKRVWILNQVQGDSMAIFMSLIPNFHKRKAIFRGSLYE